MYPITHFLVPTTIMIILYKLNLTTPKYIIIAGLTGMLIDIDHYIHLIITHKSFSLRKAWNIAVTGHENERSFIHHTKGIILTTFLMFILYFYSKNLTVGLSTGYYTHIILDKIHIQTKKILSIREFGFLMRMPLYELILNALLSMIITIQVIL